ncbi:MAG: hypothetical protein ACE5J5_03770 [Candidatus Hydrothermarchaeales archaeon]
MGILDKIRGNLFDKQKREEIAAEKIRLEEEKRLKTLQLEKLSTQKMELFNKGFKASKAEKHNLIKKLEKLDGIIKEHNFELKKISAQIRICNNLLFWHEKLETYKQEKIYSEIISQLNKLPKSKLEEFLDREEPDDLLSYPTHNWGLIDQDDPEYKKILEIWEGIERKIAVNEKK